MHDHTAGGSRSRRWSRRGTRFAAGFGAISLAAAGLFVGTGAAGAQVNSHATKSVLACEVTDTGGLNDHSFNASAYAGLKLAVAHPPKGVKIIPKVAQSTVTSDYVKYINGFIADKCNIIVTVGFLMSDATWNAALTNPHAHFAIVDNTNGNPEDPGDLDPCPGATCKETASNILGLTYETNQDGFLGGYEAAATSKTHVVATYGGENFGSVTIYMNGFADGIAYYNAHRKAGTKAVSLLGWNEKTQTGTFIGSFTDPGLAQTDTTAFLEEGASTVFPVAGGDGLGTTAAVKTWNASHSQKANVEWVDTSGCTNDAPDCSLFISSVTKGVTPSVEAAVLLQAERQVQGRRLRRHPEERWRGVRREPQVQARRSEVGPDRARNADEGHRVKGRSR